MVQSHWILWIWESLALMEVKLSQIFDYHFSWVIIYFKFEGENEKNGEKNANYENKIQCGIYNTCRGYFDSGDQK